MPQPDALRFLDDLDWDGIHDQYQTRLETHILLRDRMTRGPSRELSNLALGIEDKSGNYSAFDHGLGPRILGNNARVDERLHALVTKFAELKSARSVPRIVRAAGLAFCSIGVGSEMSAMSNPDVCWVANARSIWTHLLVKHGDLARANEALNLYRANEADSEMAYRIWAAIHAEVGPDMRRLIETTWREDKPPAAPFLWADAICNTTYETYKP